MLTAQHEPRIVAGSVDPIINRTTKQIIGYRGRLPRSMSTPTKGCKNPSTFREWATPLCAVAKHESAQAARNEAIRLLNIAIEEINTLGKLVRGQTFADYAALEIAERYQRSLHRVNHPKAAHKRIQSWVNLVKNWLPKATFWEWPPSSIQHSDFQAFIKWLETRARGLRSGEPLSASLVRNIIQEVRAVFRLAGVNPEADSKIKQPPKKAPDVDSLTLEHQCRLFACKDIPIKDRLMAGIGMGLAVRVGELLAIERAQVTITSEGRGYVMVKYGGNHRSPLKSKKENKTRRVELHEPGLGFLKIWLRDHYQGGVRLFEGPKGGYFSVWPSRWKKWETLVGREMHTHLMRHSYAVSMLSGSWGYPKKPLEFIKRQLGHTEIRTTEKYYADYAEGTWSKDVDDMVGSAGEAPKVKPAILTAEAFLNGTAGLSSGLSVEPEPPTKPEQKPDPEPIRVDRWSITQFPGSPEGIEAKAACDGPRYQGATLGRFQPRRRRKTGGPA
jgi:integrase